MTTMTLTLNSQLENLHLKPPSLKDEDWLTYNLTELLTMEINPSSDKNTPSILKKDTFFLYFFNGQLVEKHLPTTVSFSEQLMTPNKTNNSFIHFAVKKSTNYALSFNNINDINVTIYYECNANNTSVANHALHCSLTKSKNIHINRHFINQSSVISNSYLDIELNEDCGLSISDINQNNSGVILDFIDANLSEKAQLHGLNQSYLSENSRFQNRVHINGSESMAKLHGLSINNKGQDSFFNTHIYHNVESCESFQAFKSMLKEDATYEYNGKVSVLPRAQLTNSYQLNQNIILDNSANVYSRPQLFIDADDVKCSHGSTTGDLNHDEMFYLLSRGIDKLTSKRIVLKGFVDDVFDCDEFKDLAIDIDPILNLVL